MSSFNRVVLVGHLGGDPIIRDLDNQVKVADLILATNTVYTRNGETHEITDWHDIVAWRKLAVFSEKNLQKGKKVLVEGRLRTSTWEDRETGKKRKSTYVLAETIRFMDRKERTSQGPGEFSLESEMIESEGFFEGEGLEPDSGFEDGNSLLLSSFDPENLIQSDKGFTKKKPKPIGLTPQDENPKESVPF